jgi:hypothetical protein
MIHRIINTYHLPDGTLWMVHTPEDEVVQAAEFGQYASVTQTTHDHLTSTRLTQVWAPRVGPPLPHMSCAKALTELLDGIEDHEHLIDILEWPDDGRHHTIAKRIIAARNSYLEEL